MPGLDLVVCQRAALVCKAAPDVRKKIAFRKLSHRGSALLLADSDFALCQRRFVRGFDLFGYPLVGLLGTLPDRNGIPGEFVPPDFAALVDCHRYASALASTTPPRHSSAAVFRSDHDISRVVLLEQSRSTWMGFPGAPPDPGPVEGTRAAAQHGQHFKQDRK